MPQAPQVPNDGDGGRLLPPPTVPSLTPLVPAHQVPDDGAAGADAELASSTSYRVHVSKNALIILVAGFAVYAVFFLAVLHYIKPDAPAPTGGEPEDVGIDPVENGNV
jgi:hypothetical protein